MLARYCPNCGTEVDETAIFCPTCGQPIDEAAETQMPAAPAWPEPPAAAAAPEPVAPAPVHDEPAAADAARVVEAAPPPVWASSETPTRVEERPEIEPEPAPEPVRVAPPAASGPAPSSAAPPAAGAAGPRAPARPPVNLQVSMPVTLSGWLIGGGALLGALGVLIGLFGGFVNPIEFLLLVALLAVAATVFFSSRIPAFEHLRLVTTAVAFIGFGMALEQIAFGRAGAGDLLLFLGTAAAAIGVILVELGQDQPLGGPRT